jgi:hypothetical protein
MKNVSLFAVVLASTLLAGCAFENSSTLLTPTAPGNAGPAGSTTPTGSASSSSGSTSSTGSPASGFTGAWGSSSIAGLPIGNCADLKWVITEQSATSVAGTVSATCAGGAKVNANLTGTTSGQSVMNLTATGTIVASGIPCVFDFSGVGTRQTNDSMKLDYKGSYCLGSLSGTEMLRRFPSLP